MKPIWIAAAVALAAGTAAAGTADVKFVDPGRYDDPGKYVGEAEQFRGELTRHLQRLAERQLPGDQVLTIEVLDIDLAGEPRVNGRLDNPRIVKGHADWPRIELRYTLRAGDQVLASGQELVQDMGYMNTTLVDTSSESLPYEKRMLTRWFAERFPAAH